jgi:hypothetical protein
VWCQVLEVPHICALACFSQIEERLEFCRAASSIGFKQHQAGCTLYYRQARLIIIASSNRVLASSQSSYLGVVLRCRMMPTVPHKRRSRCVKIDESNESWVEVCRRSSKIKSSLRKAKYESDGG